MARGRTKGDHDAKRVQIAEAACKVFLRLGLARSSLADIATEMNCTTGVLRHYFADKDELLLYAKNLLFDRSYERARIVADKCIGVEKLRAMAIELLPLGRTAVDGYRLLAMFNGSAIGDQRLMRLQHTRNERHSALIADTIEALCSDGTIAIDIDPQLEAAGLLALIDGVAEQVIMRPDSWSRDDLMALIDRHIESFSRPPHLAQRK